jgi:hypothetical protein
MTGAGSDRGKGAGKVLLLAELLNYYITAAMSV